MLEGIAGWFILSMITTVIAINSYYNRQPLQTGVEYISLYSNHCVSNSKQDKHNSKTCW